jgi:hypothetical protein
MSKQTKPRRGGRKFQHCVILPPLRGFSFFNRNPQLKLRAIFFRACGAVFFP